MTNRNNGLSHHEELRYNYLLHNLQYLNTKEKEEFAYLNQKRKRALYQTPSYSQPPQRRYSRSYDDDDSYDDTVNADYPYQENSDLPTYPSEPPLTRPKRKKKPKEKALDGAQAKPKRKKRKTLKRVLLSLAALIGLVLAGMIFMFFKGMNDVGSNSNYSPAVTETFNGQETSDGTNILILGSDQRVTQGSTDARTDTIMVANVGNKSGKVKLVSFMRDTLVNIPNYSVDDYTDLKLNTAFNLGEQDDNQGAEYIRQVLKHNFGINVKYYVMVDFETFAEAINTLFPDGVEITAKFGTVNGESVSSVEVPDDLNAKDGVVPNQAIKVGRQRMDGRTLLNYARFRKDDDGDYGRTKRQQQVMSAIISQVKDPTKLFTGAAAVGKVFAMTSTNLSYSFLLTNGISMLQEAQNGVEQVTIPNEGDWVDALDMYGGSGLDIDFSKYKKVLDKLGMR